jgi:thymidylate kinase
MIVSFSGLDGAGKSTHIDWLITELQGMGIDIKHIEIYNISIFSIMGRLLNLLSPKKAQNLVNEQFGSTGIATRTKRVLALIRRLSLYLDICLFNTVIQRIAVRGNRWVVCDRYYYDAVAQLFYLGMCTREFYEKALRRITDPDVPILILVDPEVAYSRKPEYDYSYFRTKDSIYREMAKRHKELQVVESRGRTETQTRIMEIILKKRVRKAGERDAR